MLMKALNQLLSFPPTAGVKHHPLALQAEINPYCDQYDLRCWCQEANIALVGIHPYGNPFHVPK